MRQLVRLVMVAGLMSGLGWAGGAAPADAAAVKKCTKTQVTRVVNGKRTCVTVARFRQRATPPLSGASSAFQQALAGGSVKLRLRNGRIARPALPASVVREILAAHTAAETQLRTSVPAALTQPETGRFHEIDLTGGSVTRSADGSSATATINFGGTAGTQAFTGKVEIGANISGRLDAGFDVTTIDPTGATKTTGLTARDILSRNPDCPDASGTLSLKGGYSVTVRGAETFGSKRVKLGGIREAATQTVTSSTSVKFGADGKARPFTVRVTASHDYSRSATALAFFSARARAVGTGSMTATVNPATGQVSGATVTTTGRTSGFQIGQAAADAELRAQMEKLLNEEVGRLLEKVREAEKSCAGPYEVTLALKTDANFATHTASGTLNATLTATRNAAGEFTGSVPVSYANLAFTSKSDCAYINPISRTAELTATITVQPDGLRVKWSAGPSATATVQCPASPPPPPIPGQPGPSLLLPAPSEFTLPSTGGERTVGGGFQDLSGGWTHSGTITVTPKPT